MSRLLLCLALLVCSIGSSHAFEDDELARSADLYEAHLSGVAPTADPDQTLRRAQRYAGQALWQEAIGEYETLLAHDPTQARIWLALGHAWQALRHYEASDRARAAVHAGYRSAGDDATRAEALFLLGELLAEDRPRLAQSAWREGLGLAENPAIAERYRQLSDTLTFQVEGVEVEADSDAPSICLRYSEVLDTDRRIDYTDYLQLEPAPAEAVASARDQRLCIGGVEHGREYRITIRPGLPSAGGARSIDSETFTVRVDDRPASVGFRGRNYILPRGSVQDLPVITVNVERLRLELLRISDRNLTQQLNADNLFRVLDGYVIRDLIERSGESVWTGEFDIRGTPNREITSALPLGEMLGESEPGIHILTAVDAAQEVYRWEDRATQWVLVSDLGLTTFRGDDGLHVFLRSLESAEPLADAELRLYARNNIELGRASTNEQGRVRFAPGLLRGSGGRSPALLMAYTADGDFNFIDLTRPAFDLSDRGVTGRAAPGPLDAFLYSDRGIYRPGESVELITLVRDERGRMPATATPLTLRLLRPDQAEARRYTLHEDRLGGYHSTLELPGNARTGGWRVLAHADPDAEPIGELRFQVEDFVPQQLRVELSSSAERLTPDSSAAIEVAGEFLYGAPAAHLTTEAELVLQEARTPFPDYPAFHFGRVQESFDTQRLLLDSTTTDAQGHTRIEVRLDERPQSSRPLEALIRVALFEPGGRPVNRTLTLPYRDQPLALGIRPLFGDSAPRNESFAFELLGLDADGRPRPVEGLRYELYREHYEYYWYYQNSRWNYRLIVRDSQPLSSRSLALTGGPQRIEQAGLDWGQYRLEVHDPATGVASSLRFTVGWFAEPGVDDTPDRLQLSLDRTDYRAGDTAQVFVRAPFAGEVLLAVADNEVRETRQFSVPAEGTTIALPIDPSWSPGVYLTATAFRPAEHAQQRGPGRAVGVTWLGLDPSPRTLDIALDVPERLQPRQRVELPITVDGSDPGQTTHLTLAAVDEGILQLTDYRSPAPLDHFLGKRRLGVDLMDVYGRLIEPGGQPGTLRSGAGSDLPVLDAAGPRSVRTVALFSGIVTLDADGATRIPLELPDFNGELRLTAVAWDGQRYGQASQALRVSDPLVSEVYLPRFLAPEDRAELTVNLRNLDAPPGTYEVRVSAAGAVALPDTAPLRLLLTAADDGVGLSQRYTLTGLHPGVGDIRLSLDGPNGFQLEREWTIGVRAPQSHASHRETRRLQPGETLELTTELLADYLPDTGRLQLGLSTRPALNVAELLARLDRYPYGCLEQVTSRALPLLVYEDVARDWLGDSDYQPRQQVQQAVERVLNLQHYSGGFGLWHAHSHREDWLSAFAMDFLSRARAADYLVPERAYQRGLDALQTQLNEAWYRPAELAMRAYAAYVLTRAGRLVGGELRYLHDNYLAQLPTRLARAQLGAALAHAGDTDRARSAFHSALEHTARPAERLADYGSELRDLAALVALLDESGLAEPDADQRLFEALPTLTEQLVARANEQPYTSTQEQLWLLRAAQHLSDGKQTLALNIDGHPWSGPGSFHLTATDAELQPGTTIANRGKSALWLTLARSGIPTAPLPPTQTGLRIARHYYDRNGRSVNLDEVSQNELLVVVVHGEALTTEPHQALVVDLLPAGLEIENSRLDHSAGLAELDWLPALSEVLHIEPRDDRFVAAVDLSERQREFTLAYLARAVTPGEYTLPAVFVEDMYKPWYHGRTEPGRLRVR